MTCPECYYEFEVDDDIIVGEIVECPDCGAELEVVSVNDGEVVLQAVSVEEDWGE
nr:lysine biosynthesis protein LysW [Candidatus Bathyarchaeota archaeon]